MTFGQKLAYHIAPLFLRIVVGITLLWAGLGKIVPEDYEVTPENARALVDMGAIEQEKVQGFLDADPYQGTDDPTEESQGDESTTDNQTDPDETTDPEGDTDPDLEGGDDGDAGEGGSASILEPAIVLAQDADSDEQPKLKRLHKIAVLVSHAANPRPTDDGTTPDPLLPGFVGDSQTPKYMGWAAAVAEIFAGGFLLIGFMARLSGLVVAGVMGTAMWLTQIGPAIMGHKDALYGFLPAPGENQTVFDPSVYAELGWQLALLAAGLTLLFSGAGTLSLDRILFGSSKDDGFDED